LLPPGEGVKVGPLTASLGTGTYLVTVDEPSQIVTLSTDESDAIIRYTTDDTAPTEDSTPYTEPLTISVTTTLRAVVFVQDKVPSDELSCVYTMKVAQPVVATGGDVGGPFAAAQLLKLADVAPGVTLRYGKSTDRTTETKSSTQINVNLRTTSGSGSATAPESVSDGIAYDAANGIPISVDNTVIKVIAFKDGCEPSEELSLTYRINMVTGLSITPLSPTFFQIGTIQFTAIVFQTGSPGGTVSWNATTAPASTSKINASSGLLDIGLLESSNITVRAFITEYMAQAICRKV
jgi:hypothetical protein